MSNPQPGWYPNPSGEPGQRYWDGTEWTIVNVPSPPVRPAAPTNVSPTPSSSPAKVSPAKILLIIFGSIFGLVAGCVACVSVAGSHQATTTASSSPTPYSYATGASATPAVPSSSPPSPTVSSSSPTATATDTDDRTAYLADLASDGVTPTKSTSASTLVDLGYLACEKLKGRGGETNEASIARIAPVLMLGTDLSRDQASWVVIAAGENLCAGA